MKRLNLLKNLIKTCLVLAWSTNANKSIFSKENTNFDNKNLHLFIRTQQ